MDPPTRPPADVRAPRRRILALGGHEFSFRPPDRTVRDLLLDLARRRAADPAVSREPGPPKICLLPTASGDPVEQAASFHRALADCDCEASDVSLFRLGRHPVVLRDRLLAQDLIYAGGGSLVNLLAVWEAHDVDALMRLAWRSGVVLAGQSAGAMCWFQLGVTKSWGAPALAAGLGLLPGSLCVHYRDEPERRAAYLAAIGRGALGGYGLDDHTALLWEGERMVEAFGMRAGARASRVAVADGQVEETSIALRALRAAPASGPDEDVRELRRTLRLRPGLPAGSRAG